MSVIRDLLSMPRDVAIGMGKYLIQERVTLLTEGFKAGLKPLPREAKVKRRWFDWTGKKKEEPVEVVSDSTSESTPEPESNGKTTNFNLGFRKVRRWVGRK